MYFLYLQLAAGPMGSPHPYGHSDAHLPGRAIYQPVMLSKRFLIQSTDGGWRFFTAPQSLSNITQAGHVHFDESFFNVTFLEAIQLNDNGLKGDSLKSGNIQGNISEVVARLRLSAAAPRPLLVALIPSRLSLPVRLSFQHLAESFLYAAMYQFIKFTLNYNLV